MGRLEDYLIETTSMGGELIDLKKDIIEWFTVIGKVLDKEGWWVTDEDMVKILNAVGKSAGIEFKLWKRKSGGKYISGANFGGESVNRGVYFTVWVNPGFAEYFRRFEKPGRRKMLLDINQNAFARELFDVLAHETTHAMQAIKISDTGKADQYYSTAKQQDRVKDPYGYYTDPREIEAYALQAAIEYSRRRQSNIVDQYGSYFSENNPKVWKKFLKKFAFYHNQIKKSGVIAALANWKNETGVK